MRSSSPHRSFVTLNCCLSRSRVSSRVPPPAPKRIPSAEGWNVRKTTVEADRSSRLGSCHSREKDKRRKGPGNAAHDFWLFTGAHLKRGRKTRVRDSSLRTSRWRQKRGAGVAHPPLYWKREPAGHFLCLSFSSPHLLAACPWLLLPFTDCYGAGP